MEVGVGYVCYGSKQREKERERHAI